ncbi:MAG TPA: LysR substrate-binding domain-containing protein [Acetobacteraceae bacterium]|jgi:DNA-binding transcriptional LysR family regulator|uniref:LysR family transcriptional regulator n=1 Tax=Dyella kyungheensis TaxID=1242174 RepID=A0ABS2JSC5_9GAMM|nr:LysR substrate-binding domain-containing protein [Dyella kyungheensis]MBM7121150.1 LysR family transcriptional regulator [Dyella kyungheensis]HTI83683.1 LysR substrate-binding domain-containing protein [Acetobacteraceae bacterium]
MELRHLRYFIAVAEELHFAKAAERLAISAPTLTVQIQELERALHAHLFTRSRRSVALTPAGEAFLGEARLAVAQFERAQSVGQRAGRGEMGHIEVGYVGSAAYAGVLQAQLQRYRQAWPDVVIVAKERPMHVLPPLLEEGRIDVGLVRLPMQLPAALTSHTLLHDVFCAALPSAHVLAGAPGSLRAKALAGETFIVPEQSQGTYEVGKRGRFTPRIGMVPGSLFAVLTQVSVGAGVAIVPSVLKDVVNMPGIRFKPLAGAPIDSAVAAIYRRQEPSAAVSRFIKQIVSTPALSLVYPQRP